MASALAYNKELDGEADKLGKGRRSAKTAENLATIAEFEGNLADRLDEQDRKKMAEEVVREYEHDEKSREEWLHGVDRAIKNARQKPEKKNYPFEGASNIKYPLLTTAMNQFGARAYGAITRSDQPMICKVVGEDPKGLKAKRADRLSRFGNYQLMYMMDEWDSGTDKLLHMLPVMGAGFRKGYWRADMGRPTLEFTSARDVVVPNDAPSFDRAPRMTQPTPMYPYEIDRLIGSGKWMNHKRDYEGQKDEDTQKACIYLEQVRYYDLDGDGMMEPYIATVSKDERELVRLDAAFWANSIRVIREDQIKSVTQRVLKPQQDAAELSWLVDRQTASRLFLLEMQLLDHSCAGEGDQACRLALHPHLSAVSSAIMADRLAPAAQAMEAVAFTRILSAKADGGADLFHVMRPLTTRLALLVLRLTELASIVLLISAGLRRVYVPNTATTRFLVAIGVAWSLDFALLGIERNWNEQSLKDGIYAGLEAQRRDVTAAVISALDGAESSFLAAARPIVQERR